MAKIPRTLGEALEYKPVGLKLGVGYFLQRYENGAPLNPLITVGTCGLVLSLEKNIIERIGRLFPEIDYRIEQYSILFFEKPSVYFIMKKDPLDRSGRPQRLFSVAELEEMLQQPRAFTGWGR